MVELSPLILDIGSGVSKSGEAKNESPSSVIPTIVGEPKYQLATNDHHYCGSDAFRSKGILNLKYPIEHGHITDWEMMGKIWKYIFKTELHINPENRSVLLTVPISQSTDDKKQKDKIAEYMFEKFNVQTLYLSEQPVAALYASGRTTGIVTESGDGLTQIAPIYEGYLIRHASKVQKFAGRDITKYFQSDVLLHINENFGLLSSTMFEIARDIKEKMSVLAFDALLKPELYDKSELPNYLQIQLEKDLQTYPYLLPDGTTIGLGKGRYLGAEQMFGGYSGNTPIYKLVAESIELSDIDVRKSLAENIVLAGGNTMFKNFAERLEKSVSIPHSNPKVIASPERKYMDWLGAATAVTLSSFSEKWVEKDEWRDNPNVVHTKCYS